MRWGDDDEGAGDGDDVDDDPDDARRDGDDDGGDFPLREGISPTDFSVPEQIGRASCRERVFRAV